jgi:hypothetical protein
VLAPRDPSPRPLRANSSVAASAGLGTLSQAPTPGTPATVAQPGYTPATVAQPGYTSLEPFGLVESQTWGQSGGPGPSIRGTPDPSHALVHAAAGATPPPPSQRQSPPAPPPRKVDTPPARQCAPRPPRPPRLAGPRAAAAAPARARPRRRLRVAPAPRRRPPARPRPRDGPAGGAPATPAGARGGGRPLLPLGTGGRDQRSWTPALSRAVRSQPLAAARARSGPAGARARAAAHRGGVQSMYTSVAEMEPEMASPAASADGGSADGDLLLETFLVVPPSTSMHVVNRALAST